MGKPIPILNLKVKKKMVNPPASARSRTDHVPPGPVFHGCSPMKHRDRPEGTDVKTAGCVGGAGRGASTGTPLIGGETKDWLVLNPPVRTDASRWGRTNRDGREPSRSSTRCPVSHLPLTAAVSTEFVHRGLQADDNQELDRVGPTTIGPRRPRHVENRPVRPSRSLVITKYYVESVGHPCFFLRGKCRPLLIQVARIATPLDRMRS